MSYPTLLTKTAPAFPNDIQDYILDLPSTVLSFARHGCRSLKKIPSPALKRLYLELPILPASRRIEEWHRIGEVLQQKRFSHLTEVAFLLRETWS